MWVTLLVVLWWVLQGFVVTAGLLLLYVVCTLARSLYLSFWKKMSDSDEDDPSARFIPFSQRPEWSDVTPIPQDDEPSIVRINYSKKFEEIFNYFRAIVASGEVSERALALTQEAALQNPANYTVWQHRRFLLSKLRGNELSEELEFVRGCIELNPKNYQVWHHRRALVEIVRDPSKEKLLTRIMLSKDAKNYHAWQYRIWLVQEFGLIEDELEFAGELLEEDVRNNSAWNYRFFIRNLSASKEKNQKTDNPLLRKVGWPIGVVEEEIEYCIQAIRKVKGNASSWSYLKGVIFQSDLGYEGHPKVEEFYKELMASDQEFPRAQLLLGVYDLTVSKLDCDPGEHERRKLIEEALEMLRQLTLTHDPIRHRYWKYLARRVIRKYGLDEWAMDDPQWTAID
ncbi:unnamed protein product [Cyprideis torosa]|uniref:Protein farnesyltransferase/geranylgeranyltransferase type-1 subunit alpha n=1 Tax=Cyprideis torosa TaxID=163714 RepID=A0A7R8W825_9CRUS|nr:unnamed protein product [Cyprideis torosa]CAG0882770.1 unnamed protein product [Cyprideis torosa]